MLSVALGPMALPVPPLLLLLAVWAASWTARRLAARQGDPADAATADDAGAAVVGAVVAGLVAARVAHVVANVDLYLQAPWSVIDLRDGGWHGLAGAVAGGAWLACRSWRAERMRRPLAVAAVAGACVWGVTTWAVGMGSIRSMPAIELAALDGGRRLDLHEAAAGRPTVVNLWASWCGPCRQEMPVLAAAQARHDAVSVLFVNQGEAPAAVDAYLAAQRLTLRDVLLDPASALGVAVGSRGLPTTLFYDSGGRLIDAHFGVLNAPALESRMRRLRAASVPQPPEHPVPR